MISDFFLCLFRLCVLLFSCHDHCSSSSAIQPDFATTWNKIREGKLTHQCMQRFPLWLAPKSSASITSSVQKMIVKSALYVVL